jgi:hypothetical protein
MVKNHQRLVCGDGRYKLNVTRALKKGYIVVRAYLSCGCCTVDMAFLNMYNVHVQFSNDPKFSDTIRDDMGNLWECVNSCKPFKFVRPKSKISRQKPVPNLQVLVSQTQDVGNKV